MTEHWTADPEPDLTEPTESEAQSIAEWREEDRAADLPAEWDEGTDDEPF